MLINYSSNVSNLLEIACVKLFCCVAVKFEEVRITMLPNTVCEPELRIPAPSNAER